MQRAATRRVRMNGLGGLGKAAGGSSISALGAIACGLFARYVGVGCYVVSTREIEMLSVRTNDQGGVSSSPQTGQYELLIPSHRVADCRETSSALSECPVGPPPG